MCELIGRPMDYMAFDRKFFNHIKMGARMVPIIKKGIEPEIAEIVKSVGSTISLEDCLDVPEQVFETEYFDLTAQQKKAIEGLTDTEHIVRFTKIHQIAGGTLKSDGYEPDKVFSCLKMDRLKDIVKDNPRVVIVCRYNNEINVLFDKLIDIKGGNVDRITGEVSAEDRHNTIERLKTMDSYVLLVNAACSVGWELPQCPLMVFYSYDFSLVNYIQVLGRIQRINNVKRNTYLSLVTRETIDEDIFKAVTIKKMTFQIEIYKPPQM